MRDAAVVLLAVFVPAALYPAPTPAQEPPASLTSAIFGYVVDQSTSERIIGATGGRRAVGARDVSGG